MARVKAVAPGFASMSVFDLSTFAGGKVVEKSSKKVAYEAGRYVFTFAGKDFKFDKDGNPTKGTIQSIKQEVPGAAGEVVYSGLNLSVKALLKAANSTSLADDLAIWQGMFAGKDTMVGGAGNDKLQGYGNNDTLQGGDGDDWLMGGAGADKLDGGNGIDGASYYNSKTAVTASLAKGKGTKGEAKGDTYKAIEKLEGSAFADTLDGNGKDNEIFGLAGNDKIKGGDGNDWLGGNDGNDIIEGGGGDDWLHGGAGKDKLDGGKGTDGASYYYAASKVVVNLAKPKANKGEAKGDTFKSIENLAGGDHDDILTGNKKKNVLFGNDGDDVLDGGKGGDSFNGGQGEDTFLFRQDSVEKKAGVVDTITGFYHGSGDRIDLSQIDAKSFSGGKQVFKNVGEAKFSGKGGEIRHEVKDGGTFIYGNVDKDKGVDFTIFLAGVTTWQDDYLLLS